MTQKFELLNTFHIINIEETEYGNLLKLLYWYSCRSHGFQILFQLRRRLHLRNGDHGVTCTNKSNCHRENQHLTYTRGQLSSHNTLLLSTSQNQHFPHTARMKSCCGHASGTRSSQLIRPSTELNPSWWKQPQYVAYTLGYFPLECR